MEEVKITYEVLYNILRKEKSKPELQKISKNFIQEVSEYLQEKRSIIDHSKVRSDLFSITERSKTEQQLYNIKKIIKELYDRREKKILTIALNKSRTKSNLIDTNSMLDHEKEIFNQTVTVLGAFRNKILKSIFLNEQEIDLDNKSNTSLNETVNNESTNKNHNEDNQKSQISSENNSESSNESKNETNLNKHDNLEKNNSKVISEKNSSENNLQENNANENKQENNANENKQKNDSNNPINSTINSNIESENIKINIEFLKPVQKFIGKDLEIYGPYNEGDKAKIPKELAEVLISKENAKLISI